MEILKAATEWAKDEVFSARFFILFGIIFTVVAIGFWQLGKTEMAKAFIVPPVVAGALLLTIGIGLVYSNQTRLASFESDYNTDASAFVKSEIIRMEKAMGEYQSIVFKVIPFIIVAAALLIVFLNTPLWRAIGITTIFMMVAILLIDINANARAEVYHEKLMMAEQEVSF
ncbi:MAG: hypothetical protein R8G66_21610 [Cytophagales bacterium]|nr:hypothetical protein [Cytophagales bacterium]